MSLLLEARPSPAEWLSVRSRLAELELKMRLSDPMVDVSGRTWIFAVIPFKELRLPLFHILGNFGISYVGWVEMQKIVRSKGILRTLSPVVKKVFSADGEVSFYYHPLYDEFWTELSGLSIIDYDAQYLSVKLNSSLLEAWNLEVVFETEDPTHVAWLVENGWGDWQGGLGMVIPYGALQNMAVFSE